MQILQACALIYFIMRSGYLGIGLAGYIALGKVNAYLCPIIGGILGFIPLYLFIKISELSPKDNINGLIQKTFGKPFGSIISIILALFIAFFSLIIFWDLNNFIASEYLYNTPILAIVIMLIIPVIYMLTKGVQTLGRSSIILAFFSFAMFILSIIGLINHIKLDNILPFLENGIPDVIKGSLLYIAYSVLPIFIILIIPRNNFQQEKKLSKAIMITYILITATIAFVTFVTVSVLGIDLANLYQYADYHLLRRITIGNFIQRVESLLAIQWIISLFMLIALCFYYITNTIEFLFDIKGKKYKRISIYIVCLTLMYLSTIVFRNNTVFTNFVVYHFPYFLFLFLFILPLFIYGWSKKALK